MLLLFAHLTRDPQFCCLTCSICREWQWCPLLVPDGTWNLPTWPTFHTLALRATQTIRHQARPTKETCTTRPRALLSILLQADSAWTLPPLPLSRRSPWPCAETCLLLQNHPCSNLLLPSNTTHLRWPKWEYISPFYASMRGNSRNDKIQDSPSLKSANGNPASSGNKIKVTVVLTSELCLTLLSLISVCVHWRWSSW